MCAFHNGALISAKINNKSLSSYLQRNNEKSENKIKYLYKSMQIVGWLLFLISVGPTVVDTVNSIKLVLSYGYGILFDESLIKTGIQNWQEILKVFSYHR